MPDVLAPGLRLSNNAQQRAHHDEASPCPGRREQSARTGREAPGWQSRVLADRRRGERPAHVRKRLRGGRELREPNRRRVKTEYRVYVFLNEKLVSRGELQRYEESVPKMYRRLSTRARCRSSGAQKKRRGTCLARVG